MRAGGCRGGSQDRGQAQPAGHRQRDRLPQRTGHHHHLTGDPGAQPGERLPAPDGEEAEGIGILEIGYWGLSNL